VAMLRQPVSVTISLPRGVRLTIGVGKLYDSELKHCYKHARIALGLVNRLRPRAYKAKHVANVMRRLSRFRTELLARGYA